MKRNYENNRKELFETRCSLVFEKHKCKIKTKTKNPNTLHPGWMCKIILFPGYFSRFT